jgi:hypothetical protein
LSAKPGEHHSDFGSVPSPKDSRERTERFEIGVIEASRRIDSDVIYSPIVIFVGREVMRVLVPFERSSVGVFAGDSFGVRGIDSIANESSSNLFGKWQGEDNVRMRYGCDLKDRETQPLIYVRPPHHGQGTKRLNCRRHEFPPCVVYPGVSRWFLVIPRFAVVVGVDGFGSALGWPPHCKVAVVLARLDALAAIDLDNAALGQRSARRLRAV